MKFCRLIALTAIILMAVALALLAMRYPWPVIIGIIITAIVAAKKGYIRLTAFGTARWADADDLRQAGMLDAKSGLILGRITDTRPRVWSALKALFNPRVASDVAVEQFLALFRKHPPQALVRLHKAVHSAIFAPVGAGKSTGVVIPFLQTCPESCVVVDFKGELASITAAHRREKFGHKVVMLDPFRVVTQTPDSFNPLDCIDKTNPLAIDDCRALAEALVVRTGQEKEPHWLDSAETWIGSMLAVVAQYGEPGDRSLQTVRSLLSNPAKMEAVIKLMCSSTDVWGGMLARMGHQLTHYKDKELGSTLTTTNRFLRFLDTLAIAESTKSSSFNPAELCKGKMTVYLVLPPEFIRSQSPLLRMWIGSMLRAVVRGGLQEQNKVHFVLDEAKSLGHLESLDDAVDKYRGYGVRLIYIWQSMGQLKVCFPEGQDQTFLSNVSQVFFGIQDQQTAEYVSNRLGEETIVVDSGGTSTGMSRQESSGAAPGSTTYSRNENANWSQQARKLLKPEEVAALPQNVAITFTPGLPPICTRLIKYYEEPALGELPGFFQRAWKKIRTTAECVTLLLTAILVTAVVMGVLK
jgi:type IV secretion system protein VirD4